MWIDSHCHLNHSRNDVAPGDIVARALDAGVERMVNISCTIRGDFPDVLKTAQEHDSVWCTVGTHPHDAGDEQEKVITLEELIALAKSDDKIIGIGESGLDYYYNHSSPEDQEASFRKHMRACAATGLPLVVHTREAEEDTARMMREELDNAPYKAVMHCFSSNRWLAEKSLEMGFYISFSGIVTFKQADELREIARDVPLERILVETDAPFLAPVPYRSKTNEPAYVSHTGQMIADLHGISLEDVARVTTDNFFTLFDKAQRPL